MEKKSTHVNDFPIHLKAPCNFPRKVGISPRRAANMLVMRDRCNSVGDENEADVLKPKHSSCAGL